MEEYSWQWYAAGHGLLTGEDEVDTLTDTRVSGLGLPIELAVSRDWVNNEILCLIRGLNYKEIINVPEGYKPYLVIQRRQKNSLNPQYLTYESRIETFKNWPKYMTPRPNDLAKAGFYHSGPSDRVTCFYCSIILLNWKPTDDPWHEHHRHSPNCPLVQMLYNSALKEYQ